MESRDVLEHKIGFDEVRTRLKGRCLSSLGTEWVDTLRPMTEFAQLKEALAQAEEFARFEMESDETYDEGIHDVRSSLLRIRPERTHLEETELYDLLRSLFTAQKLLAAFTGKNAGEDAENDTQKDRPTPRYEALERMAEGIGGFPSVTKKVQEILNRYGHVKDTATPQLLSIRHALEIATRSISHTLRTIIAQAQGEGLIDRDVVPTMRDGRLVIPIGQTNKRKIRGIIHDESATGKTVFVEPTAVVEANNRIRELKAEERREVVRILQEVTNIIRPDVPALFDTLLFLGHVDYLRALSRYASAHHALVPRLVSHPYIDWRQARHPLLQTALERKGSAIVPLDIRLQGKQRILLISGPNAGGKSVCLKTVGLLQYMLQCGMPVPVAEDSSAGIFSHIFIDIGDGQSIENELSTYSGHLTNMKRMMKECSPTSLLLIDEFGGGTEPHIGGALAEAMLVRFVERGTWGVITTHYGNLKRFAEQSEAVVNGAMLYDRAAMQPLFLLQVGHAGSSFAIEIARKIGLPEAVIKYASDLVGQDYVMSDKYLQDIVRDKRYWEQKRQNIHQREKQLEETLTRYEQNMQRLQEERRDILRKAKAEAEELLRTANSKIETTIKDIREAQAEKERTKEIRHELDVFKEEVAEVDSKKEERVARELEKLQRRLERKKNGKRPMGASGQKVADTGEGTTAASTASPAPQAPAFRVGETVRLVGQTAVGVIESIADRKGRIRFGAVVASVALTRVERAEPPKENRAVQVATYLSKETRDAMYEKKLRFRPDIDLRGMRADEALTAITYFIDDAIQLEQSRVRILHGTGTGALRELVRKYLATVPSVASFHDEHPQFGGAGITVVDLA